MDSIRLVNACLTLFFEEGVYKEEQRFTHEYDELSRWFSLTPPPYSEKDILDFNRIYRRVYPRLSRQEQRKAEWLVDVVISQLERPNLAALIYGVV